MLLSTNIAHKLIESQEFFEGRRLHFYDKGEQIPLLSQGVWQVYRGMAQLSQLNPSGEEVLLGWARQNSFFGSWFTNLDTYQAKALSDLYLKWYNLEEIQASPYLSRLVLSQMVARLQQTESLLAISGLRRVEERLQQLLILLKQEMGESVPEGTRLPIRFTHQTLANAICTTRVTVTRLLGDFQRQGLLKVDSDRHLVILNT